MDVWTDGQADRQIDREMVGWLDTYIHTIVLINDMGSLILR